MSETTTPLFCLWALPAGETDRLHERPMTNSPLTSEQAVKVRAAAERDGWHGFRLVKMTNEIPDFAACIVGARRVRRRAP